MIWDMLKAYVGGFFFAILSFGFCRYISIFWRIRIDWLIDWIFVAASANRFFFSAIGCLFSFFFCNCVRITPNPFRTRPTRKKYGCFLYHQFCLLFPVRTKLPTANRGFTVCCLNNFYFSVLSFLVGCLTMYKVPKMPQHGFFFFSFLLFIEICWNLLIKNNE